MDITFTCPKTGPYQKRYRASKMEDSKWEPYHSTIRAKYVDDNLTLDQLRHFMLDNFEFKPTRKQYTSYLKRQNIHKTEKLTGMEMHASPQGHSSSSQTSCGSECGLDTLPKSPYSAVVSVGLTPDHSPHTIKTYPSRIIRRVGVLRQEGSISHPVFEALEPMLDQRLLNDIFGDRDSHDEECRIRDDPAHIRRIADVSLLFRDLHNPRQSQQVFTRLQEMISSRPADLHCFDFRVFSLLPITNLPVHDGWSSCFKKLSCRVFSLICSFWKLDYDAFSRGRVFVELIAICLLYCWGKDIGAHQLPSCSDVRRNSDRSLPQSFAEYLHKNCTHYISSFHTVRSKVDWSHMLLGLPRSQLVPEDKAAQIECVAHFVLPKHVNGLAKILAWSVSTLDEQKFVDFRQTIMKTCLSTVDLDNLTDTDAFAVEKYTAYHYLVSSYWQLRRGRVSTSAHSPSEAGHIVANFRALMEEFGMSEFDVLRHLADLILSQIELEASKTAILLQNPSYLNPDALRTLSLKFNEGNELLKRKEIASCWLSCWLWDEGPLQTGDSLPTPLAAGLGNHALRFVSENFVRTHPLHSANNKTEQLLGDVNILPTLYEGIAGSQMFRISNLVSERNSQNVVSPSALSKSQDQRSSGGSVDYAAFAKSGIIANPSTIVSTLPSEGLPDLRKEGSDISRIWGWSQSSKSSRGSGERHSGHRSISGFDLRGRFSDTLSRRRKSSSIEQVQEDTEMRDFFHEEQRCMSPRVMSEFSMKGRMQDI